MSVLSSTYLEDIPDRDRYGIPDTDHPVALHIACSFVEHIHISLEQREHFLEVTLTIKEARQALAGLEKAIEDAEKGVRNWTPEGKI